MSWGPGNIPFSLILFRENSVYTYLKNETKPKTNLACCLKTHVFYVCEVKVKVAQSCLTLCNPVDYTVHGILQARILEWAAFPSPGDLLNPGIERVSRIAGGFFTSWATREAEEYWSG